MAFLNRGTKYNMKFNSGGGNYNSAPFFISIIENGTGGDSLSSIFTTINIPEVSIGDDSIILSVGISSADIGISVDSITSLMANMGVSDTSLSHETISNIVDILTSSDSGSGIDFLSVARAFFVVSGDNILHPLGVLVTRDSRHELLPSTRDNTEEIPGMHGEVDFGTEFKPRTLDLQVVTDDDLSISEREELKWLFAKYLNPLQGAKPLIFADDIEKTYMVKYSGKIDFTNYPSWFQFTLPFRMSNPFVVGSFEKILIGSGTLVNGGTTETGLLVEISGPATAPSVTIGEVSLSYSGNIPAGEKLIIDTDKKTARIGSINAMPGYNKAFPKIPPGNTSVTAGSNVVIRWKDKWI